MPVYTFKLPDGRMLPVDAPTEEKARAGALKWYQENGNAVPEESYAGRAAGLAGRGVIEGLVEGAGGLAALPADLIYNAGVAGIKGIDYLAGTDTGVGFGMPVSGAVAGVGDSIADYAGLPEPRSDNERLAMAIGKGAIGAVPGMGIGAGLSAIRAGTSVGKALNTAGRALKAAPSTQVVAGGVAGGAAEKVMQDTGTPLLSGAAALLAGGGAAAGMGAASATRAAARPFYGKGRQEIVGDILNQQAINPARAARNMETAPTYVPGSQPLAGVASGDPGLINLQRGLQRVDTRGLAAQNIEASNAARNDALSSISMTPEEAGAAKKARTAKANVDTAALFDTPQMQSAKVSPKPILMEIAGMRQDSRAFARTPVREALSKARTSIISASRRNRQTGELEVNPGVLYSVRQNLSDMLNGRMLEGDAPNMKLARREMGSVINAIDDTLEQAVPGFKTYMDDLRASAKSIEQGQAAYGVYEKGMSSGVTSVSGDQAFLNLATLKREYAKRQADLRPDQQQVIEAVIKDIDRSMKVNAPSIRAAGSDTMQNMSIAALIGRVAGGGAVDTVAGEIASRFLGRVGQLATSNQTPVQDLMVEAMLDPKLAAALMRKATPGNVKYAESIINQMAQGTRRAAEVGAIQSQREPLELTVAPTTPTEMRRLEGLLGR